MIDLKVCLVTSKIVYHIFFLTKKKNLRINPMAQNNISYSLLQILKEKLKKARRKKNQSDINDVWLERLKSTRLPVYIEKFLIATKLELEPIPKARKSVRDVMVMETPLVAMANDIRSWVLVGLPSALLRGASPRPDSRIKTSSNPIPANTDKSQSVNYSRVIIKKNT